jgi:hypothetical protein
VSSPHNDRIELLSASATCTLQNNNTRHLERMKEPAGFTDECWVLERAQILRHRAASPVGRDRGGASALHNDGIESSLVISENDVFRCLHQRRDTICINRECGVWLMDPASKNRAASPVG